MNNYITLDKVERQEANFILKTFLPIPKNAVTLLSAKGGTGKTRLALIMADKHIKESNKNVALWLTEDYAGQVRAIFEDMAEAGLVDLISMKQMIIILDNPPQLAKREGGLFKANYGEIQQLGHAMVENNVDFAIFDPLLAFYGGNENDNSEARVFIQTFATWANESEITTLIIHHANKEGASRGATAFHDGVRARYEIDFCKDENEEEIKSLTQQGIRTVMLKKDNWGIRKHLWTFTNGEDNTNIKISPPLINAHKPINEPIIITFEDKNNSWMGEQF